MRPSETLLLICCSVLLFAFRHAAPVVKNNKAVEENGEENNDLIAKVSSPEEQLKDLGSKAIDTEKVEDVKTEEVAQPSEKSEETVPAEDVAEAAVEEKPEGSKRGRMLDISELARQRLQAQQQAVDESALPQNAQQAESQDSLLSSWGYPAQAEEENNGIEEEWNEPQIQAQVRPQNVLDADLRMALTPRAVAEYLLVTGDFSGFDEAVDDLVAANIMSQSEVREYKEMVGWEYEALLKRLIEDETAEAYLQDYVEQEQERMPNALDNYYDAEAQNEVDDVPSPYMDPKDIDLAQALQRLQERSDLENPQMSDEELLNSVMEEYQNYRDANAPLDLSEEAQPEETPEDENEDESELQQLSEAAKEHVQPAETQEDSQDEANADDNSSPDAETSNSQETSESKEPEKKSQKA